MTPEITIEEAAGVLIEWPDKDDFVCRNIQRFCTCGEYDDNSIELANYWQQCYDLITTQED